MTIQKLNEIRAELEKIDGITCTESPTPIEEDAAIKVAYFKENTFLASHYRFISSTVYVHFRKSKNSVDMTLEEILSNLIESANIVDEFGMFTWE